ncbi:MBL fold metallo-hydrolase RNA specificity domain-containing protein [Desulfobulbus alkaliphilus]|uniref:MBL fold metallo-hydrolase RNA specificity domain-containing protein n=1 Tax=Desulfobulbus alkaliphilus TaxID=869814 RepID=UPI003531945E
MVIHLRHHGARDGVTGSCHQLLLDERKSLLIDCGLVQGADAGGNAAAEGDLFKIDFPVADIVALVLTHVHIDHAGRIPWLLAAGYKGPIICSEPSAALLPIVLEDAFRLAVTRRRDVVANYLRMVRERLVVLPYNTFHTLLDTGERQVRIRLQRAGHILGSAYVECDLVNKKTRVSKRLVFSGDLGAPWTPLLPAPRPPWRADLLVLESTYGDRLHENRRQRRLRLQAVIEQALRNGGIVLIPAFSIGRTQEILYELEDILHRRKGSSLADVPVLLDSPLAGRITEVYRDLKPWWDKEALSKLARGRRPLAFAGLHRVDGHEDHLRLVDALSHSGRLALVVAGSGMCTGGRIVTYLQRMLGDPRHCVLFIGYQAAGTPGRDIQRYGPQGGYVYLDGEKVAIRARIETIGGYSAHADQAGLVRFAARMRHQPEAIRLVHGEPTAKVALRQALVDEMGPGVDIS